MAKLGYTFYPKDFASDPDVMLMTSSERGIYRDLIDLAYMTENKISYSLEALSRYTNGSIEDVENVLKVKGKKIDNYWTIPSCDKRLAIIKRNQSNGAKPKSNPKRTQIEPKTENNATQSSKQREREREREREDEIIKPQSDRSQKTTHEQFLAILENDPHVKEDLCRSAGTINWHLLKVFAISKANEYKLGGEFDRFTLGLLLKYISQDWRDPTKNKLKSETHKPNQRPTGKKETR